MSVLTSVTTPEATFDIPLQRAEDRLLATLAAGIPLSLLMDLAGSDPHSRDLYSQEYADLGWAS